MLEQSTTKSQPKPTAKQVAAFGPNAHALTREDRQRAAARTAQKKRDAGKTVRERFAEKLEADADEFYAAYKSAVDRGDWRGAESLLHWCFGRPPTALEVTGAIENNVEIKLISTIPIATNDRPAPLPPADDILELAADAVHELDADVEEA